tara:strand:- start:795 stop:1448 length:654 start_codon:yes stop_codon:yes gene_type:complete
MNNLKTIIFDYDGIISESVKVKTEAFAEIYSPFGHDIVKKVIQHHEANGGVSRFDKFLYYHRKFLNVDLSEKELVKLTDTFSNLVLQNVIDSKYVKGVYDFISLNYKKYNFFISTGTPKVEIDIILNKKKLSQYFIEVFGSPEKKDLHVKKIIKDYNLKNNEIIFIGDALSDRNAARVNGVTFIGRFTTVDEIKNEKYLIEDFTNFDKFLKDIGFEE